MDIEVTAEESRKLHFEQEYKEMESHRGWKGREESWVHLTEVILPDFSPVGIKSSL